MRKESRSGSPGARSARIVSPSDDILSRVSPPGFHNVFGSSFLPPSYSGSPLVSPMSMAVPSSPPTVPLNPIDGSGRNVEFLPAQPVPHPPYPSIVINGMIGDVMDALREIMGRSSAPPVVEAVGEISYVCPLSWVPITCPGRGVNCHHAQCFDLVEFLILSGNEPWVCPVCGVALDFEALRFDHTFMRDALELPQQPRQYAASPGVVPANQFWEQGQEDDFPF